jgi:hypothetical protein
MISVELRMLKFETNLKRESFHKRKLSGGGGRESRKAEGRAQKLAAKRETEGILAEGGGGGGTFCRQYFETLKTWKY